MEQLLRTIAAFGQDKHDGIDRLLVSLHGWSHSQSEPGLKAATRAAYRSQHGLLADTVRRWQAAGTFDPGADPEGVAQLLQSIILASGRPGRARKHRRVDPLLPASQATGLLPCCLCTNMWITCAQWRRACAYAVEMLGIPLSGRNHDRAFIWENASRILCMQRKPELSTCHSAIVNK